MSFSRRTFLISSSAAIASPAIIGSAIGQSGYPSRPLTLIVPFAAGGGVDVTSRIIAEAVADKLGQRIIVENRGGGATMTATQAVINAQPDGHTLFAAPTTMVINPAFRASMPFDWKADLQPVGLMAKLPFAVVMKKDAPQNTMKDFESFARSRDKPLLFASGGTGTVAHLAGELFANRTGVKLQHLPFRGEGPALNDLIAGHIDVSFATLAAVAGQIEGGNLKAIAVTTAERASLLPNTPTVAEQGYPDYDVSAWIALMLPKATPAAIGAKLKEALDLALATPALHERLQKIGAIPAAKGIDLPAFLLREADIWSNVIKAAGIKLEN
jgi:tripartite-type tricarboxylate transporter receptor subunit TctC